MVHLVNTESLMTVRSDIILDSGFKHTSYDPDGSLMFDGSKNQYIKTKMRYNDNLKQWIYSVWFKPSATKEKLNIPRIYDSGKIHDTALTIAPTKIELVSRRGNVLGMNIESPVHLTDTDKWYNLVLKVDTTLDDSTSRVKMWVNNIPLDLNMLTAPAKDYESGFWSKDAEHVVGIFKNGNTYLQPYDGYITEMSLFTGESELGPNHFGYDDGKGNWLPADVRRTVHPKHWGGNSFYLPMGQYEHKPQGVFKGRYYPTGKIGMKERCGFSPDVIMTRANGNDLVDVLTKELGNDKANAIRVLAEGTGNYIDKYTNDGFILGDHINVNYNSMAKFDYLALQKSPAYGFDVVTWTGDGVAGRKIPHALLKRPQAIMVIDRDAAYHVMMWHESLSAGGELSVTQNNAATGGAYFGGVDTESFAVSSSGNVNAPGHKYVAYLFTSVPGVCHVGSTVGTGARVEVPVGFRPCISLLKNISASDYWYWRMDNTTAYFSGNTNTTANTEDNHTDNGFKYSGVNGQRYVHISWAETSPVFDVCKSAINNNHWVPVDMHGIHNLSKDNPVNNLPTFSLLSIQNNDASSIYDGGKSFTLYNGGSAGTAICETKIEEDFYFETYIREISSGSYCSVGVAREVFDTNQLNMAVASYNSSGTITSKGSNIPFVGATYTAGDTIGCFVEPSYKRVTFYKNGTKQGVYDYGNIHNGPVKPVFYHLTTSTSYTKATVRFYEEEFVYAPAGVKYKTVDKVERDLPAKSYNVTVRNQNGYDNGYNKAIATIPTAGATDITMFEYKNEMYILGVNHYNGTYSLDSVLFKYNPETGARTLIQSIPTVGGSRAHVWDYNGDKLISICNRESDRLKTYRVTKSNTLIDGVPAGIELVEIHDLVVTKPTSMTTFESNGKTYMFVTVQKTSSSYDTDSVLFEMTGGGFDFSPIQNIPTRGGQDVCMKTIDGVLYLFVSSSRTDSTRRVNSELFKFDVVTKRLVSLQTIPTSGAHHGEFFEVDGEHYLTIASYYDDVEKGNTKSYLLKRGENGLFVEIQRIQTYTCRHMYPIVYQGEQYVLVANYRKGEVSASGYNTESYAMKFNKNNQQLEHVVDVSGKGCFMWSSLSHRGRTLLGMVAHYGDGNEKYGVQSYLFDIENLLGINKQTIPDIGFGVTTYKGKVNSAMLEIPTEGSNHLTSFLHEGDAYVFVANYYNGSYSTQSKLLKFLPNEGNFKEIQSIATNGAVDCHRWELDGRVYLTVVNRNGGLLETFMITRPDPSDETPDPEILLRMVDRYSYNVPRGMDTFYFEGEVYALFSSYKSSASYSTSSKFMKFVPYENKWKWIQDIPTVGATGVDKYIIEGETYFFITFSFDSANYGHNSKLLKFNKATKKLVEFQAIRTEGGYSSDMLYHDGDYYLIIANHYSNALKNLCSSVVLKRNKDTGLFESHQSIETYSCRDVKVFTRRGIQYVLFANYTKDGTNTNINSYLMKFNTARRELELVKTIPAIGAFGLDIMEYRDKLYLFMATYYDSTKSSYNTKSYMFDLDRLIDVKVKSALNEVKVGFDPDLIWTSRYDMSIVQTRIMNTVIGVDKSLCPNSTGSEQDSPTGIVDIIDDGYTVDTLNYVNDIGKKLVSWCWKKGPQYGVDIVRYKSYSSAGGDVLYDTGGKAELIFFKRTDGTSNWYVYHKDVPKAYALLLEKSAGKYSTTLFDGFELKDDRITFTKSSGINSGSYMNQAIFWRSIEGHSKIDSYTGNGNVKGPFIPCGFPVGWLLIKRIDGTSNWRVYDSKRQQLNPNNRPISINNPNDSYNGTLDEDVEFTNNGFRIKTTSSSRNASGGKYLYMAFAEAPNIDGLTI